MSALKIDGAAAPGPVTPIRSDNARGQAGVEGAKAGTGDSADSAADELALQLAAVEKRLATAAVRLALAGVALARRAGA
jgi:hypothetical protein